MLRENPWIVAISGGFSVFLFLAALISVPWVIAHVPKDYFTRPRRGIGNWRRAHPFLGIFVEIIKNLLGIILILVGIIMLVIPGQGLLTIMVGLILCNYPGKYRLECWTITRPRIWRTVNWLRRKFHAPELLHPQTCRPDDEAPEPSSA